MVTPATVSEILLDRISSKIDEQISIDTKGDRVDEVDANTIYVGYSQYLGASESDPVWRIKKIQKTGTVTKTLWAEFSGEPTKDYVHIWTNRLTLIYG